MLYIAHGLILYSIFTNEKTPLHPAQPMLCNILCSILPYRIRRAHQSASANFSAALYNVTRDFTTYIGQFIWMYCYAGAGAL